MVSIFSRSSSLIQRRPPFTSFSCAGTFDEIWVYGQNNHSTTVLVTIEYGSAAAPDGNIKANLTPLTGLQLLVPGLILQNSASVNAFASVADVVSLSGFVNSVTD